jgi:hypothetical protein
LPDRDRRRDGGRVQMARMRGASRLRGGTYGGQERLMIRETKVDDASGGRTLAPTRVLTDFDYNASAELFLGRSKAAKSQPKYKRFDTAAEAIRFVVEDLPAAVLPGAYLLVDETRFGVEEIRYLYQNSGYPLPRDSAKC